MSPQGRGRGKLRPVERCKHGEKVQAGPCPQCWADREAEAAMVLIEPPTNPNTDDNDGP